MRDISVAVGSWHGAWVRFFISRAQFLPRPKYLPTSWRDWNASRCWENVSNLRKSCSLVKKKRAQALIWTRWYGLPTAIESEWITPDNIAFSARYSKPLERRTKTRLPKFKMLLLFPTAPRSWLSSTCDTIYVSWSKAVFKIVSFRPCPCGDISRLEKIVSERVPGSTRKYHKSYQKPSFVVVLWKIQQLRRETGTRFTDLQFFRGKEAYIIQ